METQLVAISCVQVHVVARIRTALLRSAEPGHSEGIIVGIFAENGVVRPFFVFLSIYGREAASRLYCKVLNRIAPVDFELHGYKHNAYISDYKASDGSMSSVARNVGGLLLFSKDENRICTRVIV